MKKSWAPALIFSGLILVFAATWILLLPSLIRFEGPQEVDGKASWAKGHARLRQLVASIAADSSRFPEGDGSFPAGFQYPFNQGYYVERKGAASVTIKFYLDRGLLDHYSAIVYTTDSADIRAFDENVRNGGNDYRLEWNWYLIND